MSAHTPGPWHIVLDERTNNTRLHREKGHKERSLQVLVVAKAGKPIISRRGLARPTKADGEANALLIAAAPDLLRELTDLVDWLHDQNIRAPKSAELAIAKATGEA